MAKKTVPGYRVQFASDNYSGICPEAMRALAVANKGFARSYGDDEWTRRASDKIRNLFKRDCEVFFVFNGTAANSLALASLCQSYHSVICHEQAHIETDECGGPEFFSNGTKILTVPGANGKIDPKAAEHAITRRTDLHYPKPRVLSVTQPTELGTLYTPEELRVLGRLKKKYGLRMHMDGARFANAVAALKVHPSEITWKAGVDVLSFGGTKNGFSVGEAVVFFDKSLADDFEYRCKQAGQLASKMRFIACQWITALESGAWLKNARHANACAQKLLSRLEAVPGFKAMLPVQANAIFAKLPDPVAAALQKRGWAFYNFIGPGHWRFMCSWASTEKAMDAFAADLKKALKEA